jgi:hypothetical protein
MEFSELMTRRKSLTAIIGTALGTLVYKWLEVLPILRTAKE